MSISLPLLRPLLNEEFTERLGEVAPPEASIVYWFHCASVGELSAISGLLSEIRRREPDSGVVISTMTRTGKDRAKRLFPDVPSFLAPLDSSRFVKTALGRIKPSVLVIAETEIWPNLIKLTAESGTQVVMVNARLSARSLNRYLLFRPLFARVLKRVEWLFVQTEADRVRFERLGAENPRITVTGGMKSDLDIPSIPRNSINEEFSLPDERKIVVAGSVRPEEEKEIIEAFEIVREHHPSTYFVVAPRHVQRAQNIASLAEERGMRVRLRSDGNCYSGEDMLILDTIGDLVRVYGCAHVSFVGGSLRAYGGHNLLEPAMWGSPVLFGRYTDNCDEEARALIKQKGGMRVDGWRDLASKFSCVLGNDGLRDEMGRNAKDVVIQRSGVSHRIYEDLCQKKILGTGHGKR